MARHYGRFGKIMLKRADGEWVEVPKAAWQVTPQPADPQPPQPPDMRPIELRVTVIAAHIPCARGLDLYVADNKYYTVGRN